jgi:hypothetical protein
MVVQCKAISETYANVCCNQFGELGWREDELLLVVVD